MKTQSLKWRLFIAAVCTTIVALAIAGVGLGVLFERHITRRVDADMEMLLRRTAAHLDISSKNGEVTIISPPGRGGNGERLNTPYGGYYWQITENGNIIKTSRSLWDQTIPFPPDSPQEINRSYHYQAPGPKGTELRVLFRLLLIERPDLPPLKVGLFIAVDNTAVTEPRQEFMQDIIPSLAMLAAFLIAATALYLRIGLKPLEIIRKEVNAIRSGERQRFPENVPTEVLPLAEEINALLDAQEAALQRARNRAADLAHGLKTPLTAISGDLRRLRKRGEKDIAEDISQALDLMKRHVTREMIKARIHHAETRQLTSIPLQETIQPLIETLRRTPIGESRNWILNVEENILVPMDRDDLMECLGNLLENAARFAKTTVTLSAIISETSLEISVEDDGCGLTEQHHETIYKRGHRLDESENPDLGNAGLGLAIVHDILDAYDLTLTLSKSTTGGLRATIIFRNPS